MWVEVLAALRALIIIQCGACGDPCVDSVFNCVTDGEEMEYCLEDYSTNRQEIDLDYMTYHEKEGVQWSR